MLFYFIFRLQMLYNVNLFIELLNFYNICVANVERFNLGNKIKAKLNTGPKYQRRARAFSFSCNPYLHFSKSPFVLPGCIFRKK